MFDKWGGKRLHKARRSTRKRKLKRMRMFDERS